MSPEIAWVTLSPTFPAIDMTRAESIALTIVFSSLGTIIGGLLGFLGNIWCFDWFESTTDDPTTGGAIVLVTGLRFFWSIPLGSLVGLGIGLLSAYFIKSKFNIDDHNPRFQQQPLNDKNSTKRQVK